MKPSAYKRPAKPMFVSVPKRDWAKQETLKPVAAPLVVDAGTECHVTPPHVAARMVDLLPRLAGRDVLEPSAGTGNIARALLAAGCEPGRLVMVEMHTRLADALKSVGPVECSDFLEYAPACGRTFDAIVMNPPFRQVRAHVAAALSLLGRGGCLVALVPVTFKSDGFDEIEHLPETTFATAKVRTKIIFRF